MHYLSLGAEKVYKNTAYTANLAKQKADEAGVTERFTSTAGVVTTNLSSAATTASTNLSGIGSMVKEVADDPFHGKLYAKTSENAKEAASQASAMIGGIGYSLFSKVKDLSS